MNHDFSFLNLIKQPCLVMDWDGHVLRSNNYVDPNIPVNVSELVSKNLLEWVTINAADIAELMSFLGNNLGGKDSIRFIDNYDGLSDSVHYWIKITRLKGDKHYLVEFEPSISVISTLSSRRYFEFYRSLIETATDLMSYVDPSYRYKVISSSYLDAHGLTRDQIINKKVYEVIGQDQFTALIKPNLDNALSGRRISYNSWFNFNGYGCKKYCKVVYTPSIDALGKVQGVLVSVRDLTDLKETAQYFEERSKLDALTGIENRFSFDHAFSQAISQSKRTGHGFGVVFIDLDDYKNVNDKYGHNVGDAVLLEIATRLKNVMREHDHIARWGGDEFVALISDVNSPAAIAPLIDRISSAFNSPIDCYDSSISISCSLGFSLYPTDGTTSEDLVKHADKMMYSHKSEHKNQ